jgi:hypothetical protein
MAFDKRVFAVDGRYEYEISNGNSEVIIRQDYHPDLPDLVEMDEATANDCADGVLARLISP